MMKKGEKGVVLQETWLRQLHLPLRSERLKRKLAEFINQARIFEVLRSKLASANIMIRPDKIADLVLCLRAQVKQEHLEQAGLRETIENKNKSLDQGAREISNLDAMADALVENNQNLVKLLDEEKDRRQRETEAAKALGDLISQLSGMVVQLQKRVHDYRRRDCASASRIALLATHRTILFGGKELIAVREDLLNMLDSMKSLEVPNDWITPLPSEAIDTAPFQTIPGEPKESIPDSPDSGVESPPTSDKG